MTDRLRRSAVSLCLPFDPPSLPVWIVDNGTSKVLDGTHVEKALQFWPHFVLLTKRGPSLMTALCLGEPRTVVGPAADCPLRGWAPRVWSFFLSQTLEQQGLFSVQWKNRKNSSTTAIKMSHNQHRAVWVVCESARGCVKEGKTRIRWEGRNRQRSIHCPP